MDTAQHLRANGVQGGETKTDRADPSPKRTPRSSIFFLDASCSQEKARFQSERLTGRQSTDSSFPERVG
jgi:hypothetical protein